MPPGATVNGRAKSDYQMKHDQISELETALGLREANGSPIAHSAAPSKEDHALPSYRDRTTIVSGSIACVLRSHFPPLALTTSPLHPDRRG